MAITLDATVGGANANTYITLADANSFIEGLVLSDDTAAWDGSSNDNKNRALFLVLAFQELELMKLPFEQPHFSLSYA